MAKRQRQNDPKSPNFALRQPLLLLLIIATAIRYINANPVDYACDPYKDVASDNACLSLSNGVCDNPNHGGSGGEACRNQDCIDCNYHCKNKMNDSELNIVTNQLLTMCCVRQFYSRYRRTIRL